MIKAKLKSAIEKAIKGTESQDLLELVYSILSGKSEGGEARISRKQYNAELKSSLLLAKKGEKISHEALVKRVKK